MTVTLDRMKREVAAVEARLIPRPERAYQAALRRHNARLRILQWERLESRLPAIAAITAELDPDGEPWNPPTEPPDDVRQAMVILEDDSPGAWARDQLLIEEWNLNQYGHLEFARQAWAFGRDPESMWRNYCVLAFEGPAGRAILAEAERVDARSIISD